MKNKRPNLRNVNMHHNTGKKYYMKVGLLKHGSRVTGYWRLEKMLKVSTLSINTEFRTTEQ